MPSPTPKPIYFNNPQRLTQLIGANISVIVELLFTATSDPTVLGIKPFSNLQEKIHPLTYKYCKEAIDIEDIEWEEATSKRTHYSPKIKKKRSRKAPLFCYSPITSLNLEK